MRTRAAAAARLLGPTAEERRRNAMGGEQGQRGGAERGVVHRVILHEMEDAKELVRCGYDRVSHVYRDDDADPTAYAPWLDLVEARVEPGARVLDLGCGCGVPVARRLAGRYTVTGVDLSPVQIARARALVPEAAFMCADMTALTLPAQDFAAVASTP